MSRAIKSLIALVAIIAFLVLAGIFMTHSSKMLEHWAYPLDYEEIAEAESVEKSVPLSVIYAVIRTESNFDPEAESRVGARGLMQITKDTHDWIDYYRGETGFGWDDMFLPEVNADYGVWLLSYLYGKFGCWETVYAAYNAGPNIVEKWLLNPEYSADGKTLVSIPYDETSKYVEKVKSYREGYISAYDFE